MARMQTPKKDPQTVTSDGRVIQDLIDGVIYRPAVTQVDERGTLVEMYNQAWQLGTDEMCYSYQTTIRPGYAKGWVHHKLQFDRLFVSFGRMRVILYDDRSDSPTHGLLNQFVAFRISAWTSYHPTLRLARIGKHWGY